LLCLLNVGVMAGRKLLKKENQMTDFNIKDYLTVKQVAEMLGYTTQNVTHLIRTGNMKAVKRGRQYFIHPDNISNMLVVVDSNNDIKFV